MFYAAQILSDSVQGSDLQPSPSPRIAMAGLAPAAPALAASAAAPAVPLQAVVAQVNALAAMHHDEMKHWSKAMAQVLRYGIGQHSTPVRRTASIDAILGVVHHSTRYGILDRAKLEAIVRSNHRFVFSSITCSQTGWIDQAVTAV